MPLGVHVTPPVLWQVFQRVVLLHVVAIWNISIMESSALESLFCGLNKLSTCCCPLGGQQYGDYPWGSPYIITIQDIVFSVANDKTV